MKSIQDMADELGLHYNTVRREVLRAIDRGFKVIYAPGRGNPVDITPDLEAIIRKYADDLKAGIRVIPDDLCITAQQSEIWGSKWKALLKAAEVTDWVAICVTVASIEHATIPGWLTRPWRYRKVGDRVMHYASRVMGQEDEFVAWLTAQGFVAPPRSDE